MKKFELKPFDKVLVRDRDSQRWSADFFAHYDEDGYTITLGGCDWKECIPYNDDTKDLLGTTNPYEGSWQPKDGDFVITKFGEVECLAIIKKVEQCSPENPDMLCVSYYAISQKDAEIVEINFYNRYVCPSVSEATEEEKQLLLSRLRSIGKDWNNVKKELVQYTLMPKKGEGYWAVFYDSNLELSSRKFTWYDNLTDRSLARKGWIFKTKEAADKLAKELNEKLFGKGI